MNKNVENEYVEYGHCGIKKYLSNGLWTKYLADIEEGLENKPS